ncbi:MAG: aminopeptidase P family protein [Planctomycetes bacterium]|nr:aminopeptidase P family protein [Planctomycetota bacterium]
MPSIHSREHADLPILLAGAPDHFPNVYHAAQLPAGDMVVYLAMPDTDWSAAIVRNIEMQRMKATGCVAEVFCPEDLAPATGLAANRNIGFAQTAAELCRQKGVGKVVSDQFLPLIVVHHLQQAGIEVVCDPMLCIMERRAKSQQDIDLLHQAQQATEAAIQHAFELVRDCRIDAANHNALVSPDGSPLTSEHLRSAIAIHLLENGLSSPHDSIAAGGPIGADCHHSGTGPLSANQPIILDVFPHDLRTRVHGDCTRTLCRGTVSVKLAEMHAAVLEAKREAIAACKAGVLGSEVHEAACAVFRDRGCTIGLSAEDDPDTIFYPHGTGHGIGLEVHEPPLLDAHATSEDSRLVMGDVLTIEPGLYCRSVGGIRVEDMVAVTADGCVNLNALPETLWWD